MDNNKKNLAYRVRPALEEDYSIICGFTNSELEQFYFSPSSQFPLTVAHIREKMKHRLSPTVVMDQEHIIGFANFYDFVIGDKAFIGNVVVRKQNRRQGVASFLVLKLIYLGFLEHEFKEIHISCFSENLGGLVLYDKLGFKPYALERRRTRTGRTVILIHLKLLREDFL